MEARSQESQNYTRVVVLSFQRLQRRELPYLRVEERRVRLSDDMGYL
jgi:hypothetical protein